MSAIVNNSLTV